LATINSGAVRFSVTLINGIRTATPVVQRIPVNATFMGIVFGPAGRFYASGGENGNIWVGDTNSAKIIGSVNLNGPTHPLPALLDVTINPPGRFKGAFLGRMALTDSGNFLYVVDQGGFQGPFDRHTQNSNRNGCQRPCRRAEYLPCRCRARACRPLPIRCNAVAGWRHVICRTCRHLSIHPSDARRPNGRSEPGLSPR